MSAYRVRLVLPVVLWGPCELCDEASAPMAGGGEQATQETERTRDTGGEPDVSRNGASGSVPPRKDADK